MGELLAALQERRKGDVAEIPGEARCEVALAGVVAQLDAENDQRLARRSDVADRDVDGARTVDLAAGRLDLQDAAERREREIDLPVGNQIERAHGRSKRGEAGRVDGEDDQVAGADLQLEKVEPV